MRHDGEPIYVHVAENWERALDSAGDSLGALRAIYPTYCWHVRVETANNAISNAIAKLESAISELHRAGRHVLGAEQYEQFCEERSSVHLDPSYGIEDGLIKQPLERGDT